MKKITIILLSLIFTTTAFCQETVVFATKSSTPKSKNKSSSTPGFDNVVKIAPLSFIIGKIPVYYERKINDFFAVQAGFGVTSKHYFKDALYADGDGISSGSLYKSIKWSDGNANTYYDAVSPYGNENRKYKLGYMVSLEPRVYFDSDEGLDGFFLGIGYTKARYNFDSKEIKSGVTALTYTGGTVKEFDNLSTLMVSFGAQTMYDHLSLEYTTGLGIRSTKGQRYLYDNNGSSGKYVTGTGYIEKSGLAFDLTLRVGYHF